MLGSCGQSLQFCTSRMKTGCALKLFLNTPVDKSYRSLFTLLQTRCFQGILTSHLLDKT